MHQTAPAFEPLHEALDADSVQRVRRFLHRQQLIDFSFGQPLRPFAIAFDPGDQLRQPGQFVQAAQRRYAIGRMRLVMAAAVGPAATCAIR